MIDNSLQSKVPSKTFLKVLISCFFINVLADILYILLPFILILTVEDINFRIIRLIIAIVGLPSAFLWFYCAYFYYKYDRYSYAGPKLFFLSIFFTPFYFYKVVWKRKRQLINSYKSERILENKIHIKTEE